MRRIVVVTGGMLIVFGLSLSATAEPRQGNKGNDQKASAVKTDLMVSVANMIEELCVANGGSYYDEKLKECMPQLAGEPPVVRPIKHYPK